MVKIQDATSQYSMSESRFSSMTTSQLSETLQSYCNEKVAKKLVLLSESDKNSVLRDRLKKLFISDEASIKEDIEAEDCKTGSEVDHTSSECSASVIHRD